MQALLIAPSAVGRTQHFDLPVAPTAKGRPRFAHGHAFTPAKTRFAEDAVSAMLEQDGAWCFEREAALTVTLAFTIARPKSNRDGHPIRRPDLDQYVKLVMDACTAVLWIDDAQVVSIAAVKFFGDAPRTVIVVQELLT